MDHIRESKEKLQGS